MSIENTEQTATAAKRTRTNGILKVVTVEQLIGSKRLVLVPDQPEFEKTADAERWARDTSRDGFKPATYAVIRVVKTIKVSRPTQAKVETVKF
jgi:hypothetical protein